MTYQITRTDGFPLVTLSPEVTNNTATSIVLIGQRYIGYGEYINENFVHLMENFSNSTAPLNPQQGQLWWNKDTKVLSVFDGAVWKSTKGSATSATEPITPATGDYWWNTVTRQLSAWNGTGWTIVGPMASASLSTTGESGIFVDAVVDLSNAQHVVMRFMLDGTLVGVSSKDAEFSTAQIPGITVIRQGFNLVTGSLHGTSSNSLLLNNLSSSQFLRSDISGTLSGSLTVNSDAGIEIGTGPTKGLLLQTDNISTRIISNFPSRPLVLQVNANQTVLSFDATSRLGTVFADPTAALGIATKQYVDLKADIASPVLTGTPTAPTPTAGSAATQIATKAYVNDIANLTTGVLPVVRGGTGVTTSTGTGSVVLNTNPGFAINTVGSNVTLSSSGSFNISGTTIHNGGGFAYTPTYANTALTDSFGFGIREAINWNLNGTMNHYYGHDIRPFWQLQTGTTLTNGRIVHIRADATVSHLGNITTLDVVDIASPAWASGATVTGTLNQLRVRTVPSGAATFATGLTLEQAAGTNRWALRSVGSAPSVHFGSLRLGSTVDPTNTLDITGTLGVSATASIAGTTQSSSTTTGALTVAGGLGIARAIVAGEGVYLPNAANGIYIDDVYQKGLTWNNGDGNLVLRGGYSYTSTADRYVTTGDGAARVILNSDAVAGTLTLQVAPTGTATNVVSWSNTLLIDTTASSAGAGGLKYNNAQVWHANNDGAASGLDADLLDGQQGSFYQDASNITTGTLSVSRGGTGATSFAIGSILRGNAAGALSAASAADIVAAIGSTPVQNATNAITQSPPTNNNTIATTAFVQTAISSQIGTGQSWQVNQHPVNANHQNVSGKPIMVNGWIQTVGGSNAYATLIGRVGGVQVARDDDHCPAAGFVIYAYASVSFIVPPSAIWRLDTLGSSLTASYVAVLT